jgi:hypothetical protein
MVGAPAGSASGVIKGEPHFHAAVPATAAAVAARHRLSASQLALIHVGARTGETAVVTQAFDGRPGLARTATTAQLTPNHGFNWLWPLAAALAVIAVLGIAVYMFARRSVPAGAKAARA